MKKIMIKFGVFLLLLVLTSCKEETITKTLTLVNNEEVVEFYSELAIGEEVSLPTLDEEGMIFLGWGDGDDIHYYDYTISEDAKLVARFEDVDEVFNVTFAGENLDLISRIEYNGHAKVLKIPSSFRGVFLEELSSFFLSESPGVEEILIPNSVKYIHQYAFSSLENLEKISFYGDYLGEEIVSLSKQKYLDLLEENSMFCEEVMEESVVLFEGTCPIKEILSISEPVIIGDEEFVTYTLLMNTSVYDNGRTSLEIAEDAFYDLPSLKIISFPDRYRAFQGSIFFEVPSLIKVTFGESNTYKIVDGVIYSTDFSKLYYYPSGLTMEEYTIPSSVIESGRGVFSGNDYLKKLFIPSNFKGIGLDFSGFSVLEAVHVDEENEAYFSDGGVLYYNGQYIIFLIHYPRMKTGDTYEIVEGTTRIGSKAFYGQMYLKEVIIPPTVDSVNYYAFAKTKQLEYIDFPASIITFSDYIFSDSAIQYIILRTGPLPGHFTQNFPCENLPTFYVPDEFYQAYIEDVRWIEIAEHIKKISELD